MLFPKFILLLIGNKHVSHKQHFKEPKQLFNTYFSLSTCPCTHTIWDINLYLTSTGDSLVICINKGFIFIGH